jgi:SNF2 family DNA or RNA helicase
VAKTAYAIFVREQWNKIKKVTDSLGETSAAIARQWKALTDDERAQYSQRLLDEQQLVQNLTDSYYQQDPDVYMKSLVGSCGKLELLDRMLPVLKAGSHKVLPSYKRVLKYKLLILLQVLIFSQMTRLLDLLEDYFELKEYLYCRIDGSVSQQLRQAEVST